MRTFEGLSQCTPLIWQRVGRTKNLLSIHHQRSMCGRRVVDYVVKIIGADLLPEYPDDRCVFWWWGWNRCGTVGVAINLACTSGDGCAYSLPFTIFSLTLNFGGGK